MHVHEVEDAVTRHYATKQLAPGTVAVLEAVIAEEFAILNASAEHETRDLDKQKHDLLAQRDKLLQAHYAGAIPLDQLKTEQDRISTTLTQITHRLDAASADYESAQV